MFTFLKANIASVAATFVDYLITIVGVSLFGFSAVPASVIGTACGGGVNFLMGRNWVFAAHGNAFTQGLKYLIVWIGNLGLTAIGMYAITKTGMNYIIGKLLLSILMAAAYNYPLQKQYVFNTGKNETKEII